MGLISSLKSGLESKEFAFSIFSTFYRLVYRSCQNKKKKITLLPTWHVKFENIDSMPFVLNLVESRESIIFV